MQYMTHRNRWGVLERAGQLLNLHSASRIVPLLCSMVAKRQREREEAIQAVAAILWTLHQSHGISDEQASWRALCTGLLPVLPFMSISEQLSMYLLASSHAAAAMPHCITI
jgi:hypothetical protein